MLARKDQPWAATLGQKPPVICDRPEGVIGVLARRLGVTCQEVFRRAYAESGKNDITARAAYVLYVDKNYRILPPELATFAKENARQGPATDKPLKGFCMGCQLSPEAWSTLVRAYRFSEPSVNADTLAGKPYRPPAPRFVINGQHVNGKKKGARSRTSIETPVIKADPLAADALLKKILESGILEEGDEDIESWRDED